PLPELDAVAVRVADLRPRIGFPDPRTPDDLDTLASQIIGGALHVVDFERNHAVSEMLLHRSGVDSSALVRDQFDDGAAEVQINDIDRHAHTGLLDPVSQFDSESQNFGIELDSSIKLIRDDLDMVDSLEHDRLPRPLDRSGSAMRAAR